MCYTLKYYIFIMIKILIQHVNNKGIRPWNKMLSNGRCTQTNWTVLLWIFTVQFYHMKYRFWICKADCVLLVRISPASATDKLMNAKLHSEEKLVTSPFRLSNWISASYLSETFYILDGKHICPRKHASQTSL